MMDYRNLRRVVCCSILLIVAAPSRAEETKTTWLWSTAHAIPKHTTSEGSGYFSIIAAQASSLAGPIDLLINAASTLGETPLPVLLDARGEDVERVFDVNVLGTENVIRACLSEGVGRLVYTGTFNVAMGEAVVRGDRSPHRRSPPA